MHSEEIKKKPRYHHTASIGMTPRPMLTAHIYPTIYIYSMDRKIFQESNWNEIGAKEPKDRNRERGNEGAERERGRRWIIIIIEKTASKWDRSGAQSLVLVMWVLLPNRQYTCTTYETTTYRTLWNDLLTISESQLLAVAFHFITIAYYLSKFLTRSLTTFRSRSYPPGSVALWHYLHGTDAGS